MLLSLMVVMNYFLLNTPLKYLPDSSREESIEVMCIVLVGSGVSESMWKSKLSSEFRLSSRV